MASQEAVVLAVGPPMWGARLDAMYIGRAGQESKKLHGSRQERLTKEVGFRRPSGSNAMEVDQGDAGGSMATGFEQFKHMLGTPNFYQRALHRDQAPEANQEGAQNCHSVPMDYSPTGPTLRTTMIATPQVLGPRQIPPPPPQPVR